MTMRRRAFRARWGFQLTWLSAEMCVMTKTRLNCPCGVQISAEDEDGLVEQVQEHLKTAHPGMEYSREEILLVAF
ncbi:hypothetical protein JCM18899A_31460 [Nocardioides sp. AN3]